MGKEVNVEDLTFELTKKLRFYLSKLVEHNGSDLHIKSGTNIRGRINGEIVSLSKEVLSHNDGLTLAKELLRTRFSELVEKKSVDFTFKLNENYRFRVNLFFQVDGVSGVFRTIPMTMPTFESLKLPPVLSGFCDIPRGLVLVTGPTGSGKTTTLASIINQINLTKKKHIITIEDPVEFVHKDRGCMINQRSVGQDTLSFKNALRAALREDPDIILVGEMRDKETIDLALHAADTGHLVFSTLHTIDAKETINRIIAQYPTDEQNRVRLSLATVLKGIVSQRLIQTVDKKRRVAMEILVHTPLIEKLIMENRDYEIHDALERGKDHYHSQSFDQAIFDLYNEGVIDKEQALENATSASDLQLKMSGLSGGKASDIAAEISKKEYVETETHEDVFDLK